VAVSEMWQPHSGMVGNATTPGLESSHESRPPR